ALLCAHLIVTESALSLCDCLQGAQGQFPIVQNVTVTEGGTANMTCRVDHNDNTSLQWSNPAQQTLFFGDKKGSNHDSAQFASSRHNSAQSATRFITSPASLVPYPMKFLPSIPLSPNKSLSTSSTHIPAKSATSNGPCDISAHANTGLNHIFACNINRLNIFSAHSTTQSNLVSAHCASEANDIAAHSAHMSSYSSQTLNIRRGICYITGRSKVELLPFLLEVALRDNRIDLVRASWQELTISIREVTLSDEGPYTCSLFTMPVKTAKAYLTVLSVPEKPEINGFNKPAMEGDQITLTCVTSGSKPAADIRWFRNEKEVKGAKEVNASGKTFTVKSSLQLQVDRNDDGVAYTCKVDHVALTSTPQQATEVLEVHYAPLVEIRHSQTLPQEGQPLKLECVSKGNPSPEPVLWTKDGGELPDLDRMVVEGRDLTFTSLNKTDNGTYRCEASNHLGTTHAEYVLFVYDAPTTPSPSTTSPPVPTLPDTTDPLDSKHSDPAETDQRDPNAVGQHGPDHALIGGVVAVVVFVTLCLIIVLGRYLARHKGTYLTNEAKGADDAPDADTAIINADGNHAHAEEKKEYFI
ncbi:hypothetical protein NFI96_023458, partial [Prochilodus magdalenae]